MRLILLALFISLPGAVLPSTPFQALSPGALHAQEPARADEDEEADEEVVVVGTVVDGANGRPLAQAMVSFEAANWGAFTGETGHFRLEAEKPGPRMLLVEHLGYATVRIPVEADEETEPLRVRLEPDPVLLEGLEVVTNRFERRRNATATSVRSYRREELARSTYPEVTDFLQARAGVPIVNCPFRALRFHCARVRGRSVSPTVYIDEAPAIGGLDELEYYDPADLYLLEVYGRGRHIRAYTRHFMERAAERRLQPIPLFF